MTPRRKKRLILVGLLLAGVTTGTALALYSFKQNLMFFYPPSDVVAGKAPAHHAFRLGGLVEKGSLKRRPNGLTVEFDVTDLKKSVHVQYTGILPDLFREGQGIVAKGRLGPGGIFIADEVLAKHDEKYMPPEVAASLKKAHAKGVTTAETQTP